MRGLRRTLAAAFALALTAAAPALADGPVWQDAGAKLPSTVDLNAVASGGSNLIAVGSDGDTAVAYALVEGSWQRSELSPAWAHAALVDVALDDAGKGWAVGWQAADDGSHVGLLEHLENGTWTNVDVGPAPALDAVAASGSVAYVGDESGAIREVEADGLGPTVTMLPPGAVTAVRSLALTSGSDAVAVGAPSSGSPASSALLQVDGTNDRATQSPAVPANGAAQILSVAVTADGSRLAVDGDAPCTTAPVAGSTAVPSAWSFSTASGTWQRDASFPAATGSRLCDTAFTPAGDALVAGSFGGRRAVWRHSAAGWGRTDGLGNGELRGIATVGTEAWAVGAQGTILRYAVPPPPPPVEQPPVDPGTGGQQDPAAETPLRQDPPAETPAPAPTTEPAPAPAPVVSVVTENHGSQTTHGQSTRHKGKSVGRLLARLNVHRAGRNRLVVRFQLRSKARVIINAQFGKTIVGRASQVLGRGQHRLTLTFRGSHPPTRLDIVVHRLGAGGHSQGGQQ